MRKRVRTGGRAAERGILIADDDRARLEALLRLMAARARPADAATWPPWRGSCGGRGWSRGPQLPPDVVTMGSTVRLRDLETGEEETYTLVYPDEADIEANRLSVLAPVGTALLGYRAGDVVEWPVPAGVRRFRIEEVVSRPRRAMALTAC